MPLDLSVTVVTDGCQLAAVVSTHNKTTGQPELDTEQADELLNDATSMLDAIKYTMNMRMLQVRNFEQYFEPGVWQRVVQVLEVWAGKQDAGRVIANWQAIKEETAALEAERQRYHENQVLMALPDNDNEPVYVSECICSQFTGHKNCPVHPEYTS